MKYEGNFTGNRLVMMDPGYLCPDLLDLELIGPADFRRGRVVRAFFRLMELWPVPKAKTNA